LVVIDYAHTPDALEKVLATLLPVAQGRAGQLWCVFGCGGARDVTKRPLMAAIVQKYANQIVVTSDNPRSESALSIIEQIVTGLTQVDSVHVQVDRALAISQTIALAQPGDVVLLAGKGHESYQEIDGVQHPFSDRVQALKALQVRVAGESVP
jgi:UDP-N-acetylmuramoyl-L-alanyl-D-glutamate--2,6-diaminopimelate ligase